MIQSIFTTAPMLVCLIITIQLILEQRRLRGTSTSLIPMRWLTIWAISSTLLYMGHISYFHHSTEYLPLTDSIYAAMNLCVYPLFLIYISELTDKRPISKSPISLMLLLIPSLVAGITCGALYMAMSKQESSHFIEAYLYHNDYTTLNGLVKDKKIFLENDLRLEQVTRELRTNRTYLLRALNEGKGMTFKEYINNLRIEYAERLMEENPSLTKTEVATMSGYNSLSSFYRNYNTYKKG